MVEHMPIAIQRWLILLGKTFAGRISAEEASQFIETMEPLLAWRFPPAAFNFASLEHVAAACKFLPAYGEIVAPLSEWWEANQPRQQRPALNDNVIDIPPDERAWVAYWHKREAENFAPLREDDGRLSRPDVTDWRWHTYTLIRRIAPAAADYLFQKRGVA